MKSFIDEEVELNSWGLFLLRTDSPIENFSFSKTWLRSLKQAAEGHGFILLEGLKHRNNIDHYVLYRAELAYKRLRDAQGNILFILDENNIPIPRVTSKFSEIYFEKLVDVEVNQLNETLPDKLESQREELEKLINSQKNQTICGGIWEINDEQATRLINFINGEVTSHLNQNIPYVKYGEGYTHGLLGSSIAATSGENSRTKLADSNHDSPKLFGGSAKSAKDSVQASLYNEHSCISWAQSAVSQVIDYDPTLLGKVVIRIPHCEIAQKNTCSIL